MNKTLGKLHIVKELPGLWMGPHPSDVRPRDEWRSLALLLNSLDSYEWCAGNGLFMRIHRGGEVGRWMGWGGVDIGGLMEEASGEEVMAELVRANLFRIRSQGG